MKKLTIATLAIATGIVANAAEFKWTCSYGIADATATGSTTATTFYLINAAALTQDEIYASIASGKSIADAIGSSYVQTSTAAGGAANETFYPDYTTGSAITLYMACFDSDLNAVYFSEEITKTVLGTGATKYSFQAESSIDAVAANMSGFSSADGGWVAVPEPTSGLLMLLGMAGLALKRKRA